MRQTAPCLRKPRRQLRPSASLLAETAAEESELSPEYQDRIAPFDAYIVLWDNRIYQGTLSPEFQAQLGDLDQVATEISQNPKEAALRAHIVTRAEGREIEAAVLKGSNPFPHAEFLFIHTGNTSWSPDVFAQFTKQADWPFIALGISGARPDNRWAITKNWGMDRGVVGNIFRLELPELIPSLMKELAASPLPQHYSADALYERFQRADSAVNPHAWDPRPEYAPDKIAAQPKLAKEIAKDALLAKLFNSEKAVDAFLQYHYWNFLKYATPELTQEQAPYQAEFKQGAAESGLPAHSRWEQYIARKHPEFQAACDKVIKAKLREALEQLAVSMAHCLFDEEQVDSGLQISIKERGLDAGTIPEIKQAIENEDPEPLARIMIPRGSNRF